jgi:hypothetical protein
MGLEVTFLVECLFAHLKRANKLFFSGVFIEMDLQALLSCIGEATTFVGTLELMGCQMNFHVVLQMAFRIE